ncbi:MAG: 1-deoxy-D-xylulose-5-phosphate synthase [Eisenbergiella sp.]
MLLEQIQQTNDIKNINPKDYPKLAEEIRQFLIEKISMTGGHLGSNLGAVELTMAMHLALELPDDKIVWDVGHQSYTHKLLTGRREGFDQLRKYGGMSGFPKRKESDCDSFDTGHSSTSISAGLGLVRARDIQGKDNTVISVIGDGALTGGMAYEALNNAARMDTNFIIILNDNNMSISENVGGVSKYLNNIRTSNTYLDIKDNIYDAIRGTRYGDEVVSGVRRAKNSLKQLMIPGMWFEDMGITYLGPVDGHDVNGLVRVIKEAKRRKNCVLIHVLTQKGKGYGPAEKHPARFHGAEPFDVATGVQLKKKTKANYTDIFSTVMVKLAARHEDVVAITAAMPDGTGLKRFKSAYPERFFDVGIAEEHAVTFAAGLAVGGLHPVVAIYSSFLQRAYDQILHDVCLQNVPVIFAIDRAGLVGSDGETHQGIFDLSYLSSIPNMHIMAPKNKWELSDMMKFAYAFQGPIAIRYPRGEAFEGLAEHRAEIRMGKSEMISEESGIALFALGSMVKTAIEVREALKEKGIPCTLVNARFAKPIDEEMIRYLAQNHDIIVPMEENVASGGLSEKTVTLVNQEKLSVTVLPVTIPDEYVEHGNVDILKDEIGISTEKVVEKIERLLQHR